MHSFAVQQTTNANPSPRAASFVVQPKLRIGPVDDPLEREADQAAVAVMAGDRVPTLSSASILPQRKSVEEDGQTLQRKQAGPAPAPAEAPAIVLDVLRSPGEPLDAATRAYFEPRFGRDFGEVRVHRDALAAKSARGLGAAAYTAGNKIVFSDHFYAPSTFIGRRLIAHELTHVLQQHKAAPLVQREPLPEYKSTDNVTDIKLAYNRDGEVWQLTLEGDFTTPEAAGHLIWPTRAKVPPGVEIKAMPTFVREVEAWPLGQERKAPIVHLQRSNFEISGIALFTLRTMDPSFAKMFADLGLIEDSKAVQEVRAAFRARHINFNAQVLDNIDAALSRITRNNPDLLISYYRFYTENWKLTDDIESSNTYTGKTDRGPRHPWGYTDINVGVLHRMDLSQIATDDTLSLLGETLIHEYAHSSHASDYMKAPGEGKAYGIENYFTERLGDKKRDDATMDLGPKKGDKLAFDTSIAIMRDLYKIIDTGRSQVPSLAGLTAQQAREMVVEFIAKNKDDFSDALKKYIQKEYGQAALNSLPSQEKN
jgi:Domain of unknown function (DUF4157)